MLAATGYTVQMVNPFDLRDALDASTDLRMDLGDTMEDDFPVLLIERHHSQSQWFQDNLMALGIQEPITVIIMPDGSWQIDDGHNRLAHGLLNNVEVPVVFDDSGAGEDSVMRYEVTRQGVEAYHYTTDDGVEEDHPTVKIDYMNLLPFPRAHHENKIALRARA